VSAYFGEVLAKTHSEGGFDWSTISFVVIGLSGDSQRQGSPQHDMDSSALFKIEQSFVQKAVEHGIPVGIVCDSQGNVTAPYLSGEMLGVVKVVVAKKDNDACRIDGVYEKARIFFAGESGHDVSEIVEAIAVFLPVQTVYREGPVIRPRPETLGWTHSAMTD
jgi:hypothetical protein